GRSDWSTKLIRGLTSEAAAGFRSRRGLSYDDSAPVTPHNAPFPTYKAARVQQPMPVIGFLHLTSRDETRGLLPDFHQGLADAGYIEGKNVAIEYRWGEGRNDRLPSLIAELVDRQVSVIVT